MVHFTYYVKIKEWKDGSLYLTNQPSTQWTVSAEIKDHPFMYFHGLTSTLATLFISITIPCATITVLSGDCIARLACTYVLSDLTIHSLRLYP